MANIKISDLTAAAAASGTQEFEVNDSLTSKKVTGAQILAYTKANTTPADIGALANTTGSVSTSNLANNAVTTIKINDGAITPSKMANGGAELGFRNRIINGDMRIDQRNAGASVTFDGSATKFPVDRFGGFEDTDGEMTGQQNSSAPTGFTSSVKLTTTTADASLGATQRVIFRQLIEGQNVSDLAWGTASAATVTISFWVRSSLTGTHGGAVTNSAQDRSYPFTYSISVADTWEYKTITVAGDTSGTWLTTNGIGIRLIFGMGVGSTYSGTAGAWAGTRYESATGAVSVIGTLNATWYITGVQLEAGTVASPFERRDYGRELMMCQRYLPSYTAYASGEHIAVGQNISTTQGYVVFPLNVTPRVPPTGVTVSSAGHFYMMGAAGGNNQCSALAFQNGSYISASLLASVGSALQAAGNGLILQTYSTSAKLLFTGCEL